MAQVQRKLVHKQFNSPIGLYSDNNVKATLDRELKVLSNGTMGINFDDTPKPANLANSAVLRMLEEEENQKRQYFVQPGVKRVAWPPEQEHTPVRTFAAAQQLQQQRQQSPAQPSQQQQPNQYSNQYDQQQPAQQQYQQPINKQPYQQQQQQQPQQNQPMNKPQFNNYQSPQQQQQQQPPQQQFNNYPNQQQQFNNYPNQQQQQQYQQTPPQRQQSFTTESAIQQQRQTSLPANNQPSSGIITLRKEPPISQKKAPVFASQPATVKFGGGGNMRGDLKWPPIEYKQAAVVENELRKKLALGPEFRPIRVEKDYSEFFRRHALNSAYPGYKAPPGTQYFGNSNLQ